MYAHTRSRSILAAILPLAFLTAGCTDELAGPAVEPFPGLAASVTPATTTTFEGYVYGCSATPPQVSRLTPGWTLHFSGAGNVNRWTTDSPLVSGLEYNAVDANINLNNGIVRAQATATVVPDAVNGTWEIRFLVKGPEGASGVGHGTGELEGKTLRFHITPGQPGPNLCDPTSTFIASIEGEIVTPATHRSRARPGHAVMQPRSLRRGRV
jgi:hypothetical protein